MKRFSLVVLMLSVVWLSGCNTMQGIGRDVEAAGNALQKAAK